MISDLKSLISLQIVKKSPISKYSDTSSKLHSPTMIGENWQLVIDEPVELEK